jgi:hypothetical protein
MSKPNKKDPVMWALKRQLVKTLRGILIPYIEKLKPPMPNKLETLKT